MDHTYTNIVLHVVYGTKQRERLIPRDVLPRLCSF